MGTGVQESWENLAKLEADEVCRRAGVSFDREAGSYVLESFGRQIRICPARREMSSCSATGELVIGDLGHLSRIAILRYLIDAKDILPSGEWVKPSSLAGGEIYVRGTHVLPLDRVAEEFSGNRQEFLTCGETLCARQLDYGDAALELSPLPKIPVAIVLWEEDEEFPANAALLLDSSCIVHLPGDAVWATAMLTVEVLLRSISGL
ncbi:MAG: DUF3786 domain-containing protein [Anaerolineaceae bacterium]|nr:DUF3786 domain-containing protein [Anaerolineaceae bacterium]